MRESWQRLLSIGRRGHLATVFVIVVSYVLTLITRPDAFALPGGVVLIGAGVAYSFLCINGFERIERSGSDLDRMIYFISAIFLGSVIIYLSEGTAWLILYPLVGHAATMSLRWTFGISIAVALADALIFFLTSSVANMVSAMLGLVAGIVFVAIFTRIAVNEIKARQEVERLARELTDANARLREYAAQVEELATTKERNRLAREIHDGLGHYFTAINMQIEAARAIMDKDRPRALDALDKAQGLTKEGLTEVRRSVAALRTSPLDGRTLSDAINALAQECRSQGLIVELTMSGNSHPLSPQAELTLYRAVEEGLTNVRKHADATRVELVLDYATQGNILLQMCDNGKGSDGAGTGFGLVGLRERVQLLGGTVETRTEQGQGFVLQVELPDNVQAQAVTSQGCC